MAIRATATGWESLDHFFSFFFAFASFFVEVFFVVAATSFNLRSVAIAFSAEEVSFLSAVLVLALVEVVSLATEVVVGFALVVLSLVVLGL